jgi:hypothetical protein
MHVLTHTGDKPYKCNIDGCGKAFKTQQSLDIHNMQIHTGERPYTCSWKGCDYACVQKHTLNVHMLTHTGEKPYKCDVNGCAGAFTCSHHLHEHVRIHHNPTYVARKKQAEEQIRKCLINAGWKEHFGDTLPPINSFKREKKIDFTCLDPNSTTKYAKIDFFICTPGGLVFLEVDEQQHRFGYHAELSCDMKRMNQVTSSLTLELGDAKPHIYWLRYNPNAWHVEGITQRVLKVEREERLMAHLAAVDLTEPLQVGYAYYDSHAGELDVLRNEDYHPTWAEMTHNLEGFGALIKTVGETKTTDETDTKETARLAAITAANAKRAAKAAAPAAPLSAKAAGKRPIVSAAPPAKRPKAEYEAEVNELALKLLASGQYSSDED